MINYKLAGWRVLSELPLPDLLPWRGAEQAPDLVIRLGRVPDRLDDLVFEGPLLQVARDGACHYRIPNVAAYLIDAAGQEVVVEASHGPEDPAVRVFLLGTVFGILCYKRKLLPLHACCVAIGGRAVAFAGPSGIGKSTLAAAFLQHGHAVLADDVTAIDMSVPGCPVVLPVFPRLKLWRDAMEGLNLNIEGLECSRPDIEKYHLPVAHAFASEPMPLAAVYHLRWASEPRHEQILTLNGLHAISNAGDAVYRDRVGRRLTGDAWMLKAIGALCAAVPAYSLICQSAFPALQARVGALVARHVVAI